MRQWKRGCNASFTVEMSVVVPLAVLLIMTAVLVMFYYHDKNILSAAAYETAVAGGTKAREKDGIEAGELEAMLIERIHGKCILFAEADVEAVLCDEEIVIKVSASRRGMRLTVEQRAAVTEPEKEIRRWRRFL